MRKSSLFLASWLSIFLIGTTHVQESASFSDMSGPYLGQKPPGKVPELFAPGIVSTDADEGCSGFMNNGTTFIFNRVGHFDTNWTYIPIYRMDLIENEWTAPAQVQFQERNNDDNFTVAPDGITLIFQSMRAKTPGFPAQYSSLWKTTITEDSWTKPEALEYSTIQQQYGGYPSMTNDGIVYFASGLLEGYGDLDIYRFELEDGQYSTPENIGKNVNTEFLEHDSFIAPDESFIVLCSVRPGGIGGNDLYVSFKTENGTWTKAINMGEGVNTKYDETRPSITPDGRYFFFCSNRKDQDDIFWVDASVILDLRS